MRIESDELLGFMLSLHDYYRSAEGLDRAEGLSKNGQPDFEGIASWVLDVFLNSRLSGLSADACRHNAICAIERTTEWSQKHPGRAPQGGQTAFNAVNPVGRVEFLKALHRLDVFYKSWSGLQRPTGLSLGGTPDFRAIAAWVFGVYLNARLDGKSPEESWDRLISIIRSTAEWQSRQRDPVDRSTLNGKHLVGCQCWFGTPDDGQNNGWDHWFGVNSTASEAKFDLWPDTREFFESELSATSMVLKDGSPAKLYSSHNDRTMRRHFDWMADAGLDGASIGRFFAGTRDQHSRRRLDHALTTMAAAAETTGRVFFVWYDVTDSPHNTFVEDVKRDWEHVHHELSITSHSRYLHHNGRPFIGIWGAGAEGRPGTPEEWIDILNYFKTHRSGATVLLGGARDWRVNQVWGPVFAVADVVSPWAINAFVDDAGADAYKASEIVPDLALASSRGQGYLPTLFPGFSWHNLQRQQAPFNSTARRNGDFYWRQAFNAVDAGATVLFTAMFDEVDEGTAILKVVETQRDVPADGSFLSLDFEGRSLPSDWYLRLAGAARHMLRREIGPTRAIPIQP